MYVSKLKRFVNNRNKFLSLVKILPHLGEDIYNDDVLKVISDFLSSIVTT